MRTPLKKIILAKEKCHEDTVPDPAPDPHRGSVQSAGEADPVPALARPARLTSTGALPLVIAATTISVRPPLPR